ncbi:MAG: TolC family protein [Flavobacteriales bacterium]|nr:TolC family protein [Flavobacteriales bacterium]
MRNFILLFLILIVQCVFSQNTLQSYIEKAKENSPLIKDNINQSKINQLESDRLKAFYTKPQIGITANYLFAPILSTDNNKTSFQANPDVANDYYGYDLAASNGGTYQALLNVTQPLFNGKQYRTASELLATNSKINKNNVNITAHDLEKIIGDQYILCVQDKMQLNYVKETLKLIIEQEEILEKLVKNGIYKQSDLTALNIEHQNMLSQQSAFKASYRRNLMDLNILCGINDTGMVELQNTQLVMTANFNNSSFLEKYRLDSLNLVTQEKIFNLKYQPKISLFANTGLNAVYAPTIPNRFGMSAGITFSYNLFDGGQKSINKEKIKIQQNTVSTYRKNFITQNTIRKNKIAAQIKSYNERIELAQQQINAYKTLINTYKKEIVQGQLSIINYITTLKNMAIVKRDYTLLFAQKQSLINAYNYWNW